MSENGIQMQKHKNINIRISFQIQVLVDLIQKAGIQQILTFQDAGGYKKID